MIDFTKLREGKSVAEIFKERQAEFAAKDARIKLMLDKLYDQYQRNCIGNDFAEAFITSCYAKHNGGIPLTDKQISKLEELFEKY